MPNVHLNYLKRRNVDDATAQSASKMREEVIVDSETVSHVPIADIQQHRFRSRFEFYCLEVPPLVSAARLRTLPLFLYKDSYLKCDQSSIERIQLNQTKIFSIEDLTGYF